MTPANGVLTRTRTAANARVDGLVEHGMTVLDAVSNRWPTARYNRHRGEDRS
jgi:hypothetical protein